MVKVKRTPVWRQSVADQSITAVCIPVAMLFIVYTVYTVYYTAIPEYTILRIHCIIVYYLPVVILHTFYLVPDKPTLLREGFKKKTPIKRSG